MPLHYRLLRCELIEIVGIVLAAIPLYPSVTRSAFASVPCGLEDSITGAQGPRILETCRRRTRIDVIRISWARQRSAILSIRPRC